MADSAGPTAVVPNKQIAMSRALGAAFLTHQVEQLEKSVSVANGPGSRNWRDRDSHNAHNSGSVGRKHGRQVSHGGGQGQQQGPPGNRHQQRAAGELWIPEGTGNGNGRVGMNKRGGGPGGGGGRRRSGGERDSDVGGVQRITSGNAAGGEGARSKAVKKEKDADLVVIDASVLVHGLGQVKKWCREGREEIVVVPLEALNTLDLLKKGTTPVAQRARQASRILEAQVGTNPRIRVQQDNAFVLWDSLSVAPSPEQDESKATVPGSPEWVRRTICCAKWQVDDINKPDDLTATPIDGKAVTNSANTKGKRVVLAVVTPPSSQPFANNSNTTAADPEASPVPLPAPHLHGHGHGNFANKYEGRVQGGLVAFWAKRAGIEVAEFPAEGMGGGAAAAMGPRAVVGAPVRTGPSGEEEDGPNARRSGGGSTRGSPPRTRPNHFAHGHSHGQEHGGRGGGGANRHRKNSHSQNSGSDRDRDGSREKERLVDRPAAVKKMMEMVKEPSVVVRVLARGEKLDP